jgi:hypothetical protein
VPGVGPQVGHVGGAGFIHPQAIVQQQLDFREFCRRSKLPQSERSWDLFAAERYRRGETRIPSYEAYNPFRHRQPGPYA